MSKRSEEIISLVEQEIGIDAYHMYPDTRHAIPDTVLWGFASACILEFSKGFIDFKKLGESVRTNVNLLLKAWKLKENFDTRLSIKGMEEDVLTAIDSIRVSIRDEDIQVSHADTAGFLHCSGIRSTSLIRCLRVR